MNDYVRILPGFRVWRDYYRWFITLFSGETIWFYQSDVCGLRIKPNILYRNDSECLPRRTWVELLVECDASEHPIGSDS